MQRIPAPNFSSCALEDEEPIGFLAAEEHTDAACEIAVMGVLPVISPPRHWLHLIEAVRAQLCCARLPLPHGENACRHGGQRFLCETRAFYLACGFEPLEIFETLWNEETDSFRIYDDYWSDIVAEIPEGYVQDEVQKTVQLSTPESLVWFGKEVNSGKSFAGYTITVTNDIDMSGHYWTPIDTETIQYNDENGSWSTIDPQKKLDGATITGGEEGHTITGLATSTGLRGPNQSSEPGDGQNCYYYSAFIGRNDGALTVQNLTFENASIAMTEPDDGVASNGSSMCATVVALNSGTLTLDSVSVVGSNILAFQKAAALVAYTTSSLVVQQCEVADNTISAYFQVAPVVGYSAKNNSFFERDRAEQ